MSSESHFRHHRRRSSGDQPTTEQTWNRIKSCLPDHLDQAMIGHYIDSLDVRFDGDTAVLEVPNVNYYQGLVDHILPVLGTIRSQLAAAIHFSIQIRPRHPVTAESSLAGQQNLSECVSIKPQGPVFRKISDDTGMDKRYTFDNYIKGSSNQFSYAICQNIVQKPGATYNPLFIYGFSGLGKTHLLHAVGNALSEKHPNYPVILTTTDNFMSELIYCIRHNKQHKFKEKYRQCSALLVDDIQFISGKKATQEEFFHVFNFLYEKKIQIIITSDKYPHEISDIEERLRNRFEWGLISDIQPPDQEHRMAILYAKAEHLGLDLDAGVAEYMARRWSKNIRELEGALRRLVAHASFHNRPMNLELVHEVFHMRDASTKPNIQTILETISRHYDVTIEEIRSSKRPRKIVLPRQVGFYLARQLTGASFPEIGQAFGGKDHSTVMHGVKKVTDSIVDDKDLRKELGRLQRMLSQRGKQGK